MTNILAIDISREDDRRKQVAGARHLVNVTDPEAFIRDIQWQYVEPLIIGPPVGRGVVHPEEMLSRGYEVPTAEALERWGYAGVYAVGEVRQLARSAGAPVVTVVK